MVSFLSYSAQPEEQQQIKNFNQLTASFASAGLPTNEQLTALKKSGFQHIINLIPGDYSYEQKHAEALEMTFDQIEVDWHNPTLQDFKDFSSLMTKYSDEKVLVHCKLNYRASAFAYLYQVKHQGADKQTAEQDMLSIWAPDPTWTAFIANMLSEQ